MQTVDFPPAERKDTEQDTATIRQEVEALTKANQQLQDELLVMKNFLRAISHNLGNPLNGLKYLLNEFPAPAFTGNWNIYYRTFHSCYIAINDLKENTDAFMNPGEDKLLLREIDIMTLIDSLTLLAKPLAYEKGIDLKLSISPDTPEWIASDQSKLSRIVLNLISNAIKFSSAGTTVYITTTEKNGNFVLTVQDHGIGISQDKLQTIFQPGVRLDKSKQGLGIGLHVSRSYTSLLKGTLSATSQLQHGSTFSLTLPITHNDVVSV